MTLVAKLLMGPVKVRRRNVGVKPLLISQIVSIIGGVWSGGLGARMASAGARAYKGGLGAEPHWSPRAKPLVRDEADDSFIIQ